MELKNRIIEEATRMMVSQGVKAMRMDDVAENLSISKKTIYELFENKEALILACAYYYINNAEERFRTLTGAGTNIIEEFILALDYWEQSANRNYNLMSGMKKFYPKIYAIVEQDHYSKTLSKFRQKLEQGKKDGYILNHINIDLSISVLLYSFVGLTKKEYFLPDNVSETDAFQYITVYFFRGITTEKGIKLLDDYITNQIKSKN
jgi:AcrR family transcriptional regulator